MLPQVKTVVSNILASPNKPVRITVGVIQRALKMPPRQINNLPKCLAYIHTVIETEPEYQERKLQWQQSKYQKKEKR